MMHNGWGNVQWLVDHVNASSREMHFQYGGFQHGRSGGMSSYWIENVKQLLDAPGEWWLDERAQRLYLWPNTTLDRPTSNLSGAVLTSVVHINGSAKAPVRDLLFVGIDFGQTAPTYLSPHERPISGDWGIHRGGTVHLQGAVNVTFSGCGWRRTGGNGLIFDRYVKNSSVIDSEFVSIGDSAVVAYGDANWTTGDIRVESAAPGYPSGLLIARNLMHEIGVWGKQTSCFFQG